MPLNPWMMNYIMTILKQEHIDCIQKNVALAGAIGELPVCCSEICKLRRMV